MSPPRNGYHSEWITRPSENIMPKHRPKKIHAFLEGSDNQAVCSEVTDPRVKRTTTNVMSTVDCRACLEKLQRKKATQPATTVSNVAPGKG